MTFVKQMEAVFVMQYLISFVGDSYYFYNKILVHRI